MKAHSIGPEPPYPSRETSESAESTPTKMESRTPKKEPTASKNKKRKAISDDDENDEEDMKSSTPACKSRKIKKGPEKKELVKQEQISPKSASIPIKEESAFSATYGGSVDGPSDYALTLQRWGLNPALAYSNQMPPQELTSAEPQMDSFPDFPDPLQLNPYDEPIIQYGEDGAYGSPVGLWDQSLGSHFAKEHLNNAYPLLGGDGGQFN